MNVLVTHIDFDNPEKTTWTEHRDCDYTVIDSRVLKVFNRANIKAGGMYANGVWLKVEYY